MTAFRATFSDMKLIKTRQVTQLIFEIPSEEFDTAYEILGGVPIAGKERWFGIAAIDLSQAKEAAPAKPGQIPPKSDRVKRDWRQFPPSQQAGIRCEDAIFSAFLRENYPDEWREAQAAKECIYLICAVDSRAKLNDGPSRVLWHQLDEQFSGWKALENA